MGRGLHYCNPQLFAQSTHVYEIEEEIVSDVQEL